MCERITSIKMKKLPAHFYIIKQPHEEHERNFQTWETQMSFNPFYCMPCENMLMMVGTLVELNYHEKN